MSTETGTPAPTLEDILADLYTCGRDRSAWGVGTMGEEDFTPAGDDPEVVADLTAWRDAAVRAALTGLRERLSGAVTILDDLGMAEADGPSDRISGKRDGVKAAIAYLDDALEDQS